MFEAFERKKGIIGATSSDHEDQLWTDEEFYEEKREVPDPTDATKTVEEKLEAKAKKLYLANAISYHKMVTSVPQSLVKTIKKKGGPKMNMYKVKEWMKFRYGTEDMILDLNTVQSDYDHLSPADFEEAIEYFLQMEALNEKLEKLSSSYKNDEQQM